MSTSATSPFRRSSTTRPSVDCRGRSLLTATGAERRCTFSFPLSSCRRCCSAARGGRCSPSSGSQVVLFGIPGSFTKTCSENHLPPFVSSYDQLYALFPFSPIPPSPLTLPSFSESCSKNKGVDSIYCISSNDLFVQSAFGRVQKTGDKVIMLGDPNYTFLEPTGLTQDRKLLPPFLPQPVFNDCSLLSSQQSPTSASVSALSVSRWSSTT